MNKIFHAFILFSVSFSIYSFDKFDADVCEANTDVNMQIKCFRDAGFPSNCRNQNSDELTCYREIVKNLEKTESIKDVDNSSNSEKSTDSILLDPLYEKPIPKSIPGDRCNYFLLNTKKIGTVIRSLTKQICTNSNSFTLTETECSLMKMKVLGDSFESASKIKINPSNWFDLVPGSSKSDLFNYLCANN